MYVFSPFFPEMAVSFWNNLLQITKNRVLQQRGVSLYNYTHGFEEHVIKKKLEQFAGGSINLSKDGNGIGVLTVNNPRLMNAFTGNYVCICMYVCVANGKFMPLSVDFVF